MELKLSGVELRLLQSDSGSVRPELEPLRVALEAARLGQGIGTLGDAIELCG